MRPTVSLSPEDLRRLFARFVEEYRSLEKIRDPRIVSPCDGGLTERIILPARKFHVANRLTIEQCALVETLAIGCHAIDRANADATSASAEAWAWASSLFFSVA